MTKSGREDDFSGTAPEPGEAGKAAPAPDAPAQTSPALEAARKSVEDAATISGGLWLSYLFALFYFGVAAGGVTHKDLLLENAVKLPFLNVELPLVAFFFLAPILFFIVHAYTLVHFVMLAAKVGAYDKALRGEFGDTDKQQDADRRRLPSNIFVQFLAGPHEICHGGLGWILLAIAWISLVIGPVLLLLLIQAQFLPYHLEWVTWVQRFAIFGDVILLWALWPAVLAGRSSLEWPKLWRHPVLTLASFFPIGLAFTAATFPGEWLDESMRNVRWIPATETEKTNITYAKVAQGRYRRAVSQEIGAPEYVERHFITWTSFHDVLFNGRVDDMTRRRKSLFSNTLVLPGFDLLEAEKIDDQNKLNWAKHTFSFRARHLEGARFDRADLRKTDLEGAHLQGASLDFAQLQGTLLAQAQLQGASLAYAQLQGALLTQAQLQGASLYLAQLQAAWLFLAQLQGAALDAAQLQGAALNGAQLQGASLEDAQLQGAQLRGTQLQGANFDRAGFAGTDMQGAALWRTRFEAATLTDVFMDQLRESPLSSDAFAALRADIVKEVGDDTRRNDALDRVGILDPGIIGPEMDTTRAIQKQGVDLLTYQIALADELKKIACSGGESATSVVHALNLAPFGKGTHVKEAGPFAPKLAEGILAPDCPVSAALTDDDRVALKKIAETASQLLPQTSTPPQSPKASLDPGGSSH